MLLLENYSGGKRDNACYSYDMAWHKYSWRDDAYGVNKVVHLNISIFYYSHRKRIV